MQSLDSRATAQGLIERIRLEHSPQGRSKLSSIIKNALDILSAELYDTSTHFLREFIQNADDNNYDPDLIPWLQISYNPGFLRVDCNEVGFAANNVEAICTIRSSTKSGRNHSERTGEKGIGFKSVFKIADVVWISSREYAFKFDKNIDFGIIAPIWDEFPRRVLEKHTSYLIQLDNSCDEGHIVDSLRNFDHTYLLFLRRLRRVTLNVVTNGPLQTLEIRRRDEIHKDGPVTVIEMGEQEFTSQARVGVENSELILAFPERDVAEDGSKLALEEDQKEASKALPVSESDPEVASGEVAEEAFSKERAIKGQNVHAILPIGQYGLKFIVQGDFLQTANRRHIDTSSLWNIALRDAIPGAFTASISRLRCGRMRFSWPAFIPSTETNSFFEPVRREIVARLKDLPILESFSGQLAAPSKLMYVDERFLGHAGEPLCLSECARSTYLSHKYPRHLKGILCSLGVEEMSTEKFVEHFEQMILEDEEEFRAKPDDWHSEVARTLLPLIENGGLKETLRRLPIIPLSNGEWVSATSEPHMFQLEEQSMLGDLQVLRSVRIIHPDAMKNGNRRSLWSSLDIQPIDRQGICQYIVGAHENPVVDPMVWTRAQLVAHVKFLYTSEWRPSRPVDLWVETSRLRRLRSSKVYYLTGTDHDEPTTRVLNKMQSALNVLHDDYFDSNTALEDGNESISEKANEESGESGSPKTPYYFEDAGDAQEVTYPISEGGDDSHSVAVGNSVESETEETSESIDGNSDSTSTGSTAYLEDIADTQTLAYPFSTEGFREFLYWKSLKREWDHLLQNKNRHDETNAIEDEDKWLPYLKDVLQVATLPRLAETSPLQKDRGSLILSSDMKWLFYSCNPSDVLHVLVSNWQHYAHLIERQGTSDQSEEEKLQEIRNTLWHQGDGAESPSEPSSDDHNARLVRELQRMRVNVSDLYVQLGSCVLPKLDPRFDEDLDIPLATLDLGYLSNDARQRLKFFQISVEADANYYSKCLHSMTTKSAPPHSTVKRLYEELQSRYDRDEGLIRTIFSTLPLVYCSKRTLGDGTKQGSWMIISDSMERGFDLISEYPTCAYLFRSLCDPANLQTTSLINGLGSNLLSKSEDRILEVLEQLSQRLKGLEPKQAAEKVKSLKGKKIFPVSDTMDITDRGKSHRLVSANNSHWYIDDTNEFRRCFGGKVPLLAVSPLFVVQLADIFAALNLDSRKLSEVTTRRSIPVGRQRFLTDTTAFLRSRHGFLDLLIPKDHSGGRDTISVQFRNISAFSAADIVQTFKLVTDRSDLTGRGPSVQASTIVEGDSLRLFFTESNLDSLPTSWQWVDLLAEHMKIHDKSSQNLLFSALTDRNTRQVYQQFESRGYTMNYTTSAISGVPRDPKSKYLSMSGDAAPMLPGFDIWRNTAQNPGRSSEWTVGAMSHKTQPHSRQIPLIRLLHNSGGIGDINDPDSNIEMSGFFEQASSVDAFSEFETYFLVADPYDHEQYITECMVSQLFQDRLGELYDPVKCWTSSLRSRSGLPEFENDSPDSASFTMEGRDLSKAIWKLLLQSSYRYAAPFSRKRFSIDTVYHFEVFMTAGDSDSWFPMDSRTLENAHWSSYIPSTQDDEQVFDKLVVWVRIYFAFTSPRFEFIVDPWLYYVGGGMYLRDYDKARIPLVDNPAEDPKLKQSRRRVDDLTRDVNVLGPQLNMLNRRGMESSRRKAMAPAEDAVRKGPAQPLEYHYTKLEEGDMRLFVLFRGEDHDILRGLVCHMPFEDAGAYRALSYVWGPEQANHKKRTLVTPQGILRIRTSLGAALQRLRRKTKDLVLWVDAICINQDDEDEKIQQISLLPQIFQGSICTLAVVATDEKSEKTVRTLLQIAAVREYGPDIYKWPAELGILRAHAPWLREGLPAQGSTFWQDVEYFFRRPWFRRAWIVQEAIAARTVTLICGKWMIDWNALRSAMEMVDKRLGTATLADAWQPFMMLTEHREYEARAQRWPLLYLLETFRYVQVGLQRDRFFSLLGLASDADNPLFDPDYRSPFEDIVRRFGQAFVDQGEGIRLLSRAGLGHIEQGNELRASRFPSWVPDWTRPTRSHGSLSSAVGRGVTFSASGKLNPFIFYDEDDDILEVAGKSWRRIVSVGRFCNEPSQRSRYFQEIDTMIESCDRIPLREHQRLKETVPIAGALYPETGVSSPVSVSESYMAYRKVLRKDELRTKSMRGSGKRKGKETLPLDGGSRSEAEPILIGFREKSKTYAALLDTYILGWRFFITTSGRCGIAPPGVLAGDIVAIVSGGNVPFIFRYADGPGHGCFLVGECYMDGVMFGEAVKEYKEESEIPTTFFIR